METIQQCDLVCLAISDNTHNITLNKHIIWSEPKDWRHHQKNAWPKIVGFDHSSWNLERAQGELLWSLPIVLTHYFLTRVHWMITTYWCSIILLLASRFQWCFQSIVLKWRLGITSEIKVLAYQRDWKVLQKKLHKFSSVFVYFVWCERFGTETKKKMQRQKELLNTARCL